MLQDEVLAIPMVLKDEGRLPVPVDPTTEVELAGVAYGAEDDVMLPARLDELGEVLPVPVGPAKDVELDEVWYGADDDER